MVNNNPQSPQDMDSDFVNEQDSQKKRTQNKKKVIIGIIILSILGIFSSIILQNPQWLQYSPNMDRGSDNKSSVETVHYYFYPTDYELDITKDEIYMDLDHNIYYKNGNETFSLGDEDPNSYSVVIKFFCQYFETVIAGNAEVYNTYFTDSYYDSNDPYQAFAPQMLYDILIERLSSVENDKGDVWHSFDVTYKIHKNDGSFRNDMGSDASRRLRFELFESGGVVKINKIQSYVYG